MIARGREERSRAICPFCGVTVSKEGAKIVEMEQAGCLAVAQARGFAYGALIYGGDDVSQDEWSGRKWFSRKGVRYNLVHLCRALVDVL